MQRELIAEGYIFIEGPRLDRAGNLWFSDLMIGGIFRRSPDGRIDHYLPDRKFIGGLAMNADGSIVVSGHGNLLLFDPATGRQEVLLDSIDGKPCLAFNDIQPDDEGGLYAGAIDPAVQKSTTLPFEPQPLIQLTAGRQVRRLAEDIKVTNGIGLSPDRRTLYQAETPDGVLAYDRADDGSLSNRRLLIEQASTDGLAVDSEGGIWIAAMLDRSIKRYAPDGTLDRRIEFPEPRVTSLVFGGTDLKDLYVVTASSLKDDLRQGNIYRLRSDIAGQPTPETRF